MDVEWQVTRIAELEAENAKLRLKTKSKEYWLSRNYEQMNKIGKLEAQLKGIGGPRGAQFKRVEMQQKRIAELEAELGKKNEESKKVRRTAKSLISEVCGLAREGLTPLHSDLTKLFSEFQEAIESWNQ